MLRRRFLLVGALCSVPSGAAPARAQSAPPSEYEVKAAYLYNFAKFIEWPPDSFRPSGGTIVFGVLGEDPFGALLDRIAREERVLGRRIAVKRARRIEDLGACHVLFVRRRGDASVAQVIRSASAHLRLVVGEDPGFAELGGSIGFFLEERRVKFAINVAATERAGLKVSSKLLRLAKIVR